MYFSWIIDFTQGSVTWARDGGQGFETTCICRKYCSYKISVLFCDYFFLCYVNKSFSLVPRKLCNRTIRHLTFLYNIRPSTEQPNDRFRLCYDNFRQTLCGILFAAVYVLSVNNLSPIYQFTHLVFLVEPLHFGRWSNVLKFDPYFTRFLSDHYSASPLWT